MLEHSDPLSLPAISQVDPSRKPSEKRVHLEVEAPGYKTQVFYFVNVNDLKAGISLRKNIEVRGIAQGMDEYVRLDLEDNEKEDLFQEILAVPLANKASFLAPKIPSVKTRLLNDQSYKIELISGLSYAVILNPHGLYDKAPIYKNILPAYDDREINFSMPHNAQITGQINGLNIIFNKQDKEMLMVKVMQGARLLSSVAKVGVFGSFSLEMVEPVHISKKMPLFLMIEPLETESGLPTIKHALDVENIYKNPDIGVVDLGDFSKPFSLEVEVSFDDQIISEADVYINGHIGAGEVLIKKAVNKEGKASFDRVYEGIYDIAAILPSESPYGMRIIKHINLRENQHEPLVIRLDKRQELSAFVSNEEGQGIMGAHVELSRIGEVGALATADIIDDLLFKKTMITNKEGAVCDRTFNPTSSLCEAPLLDKGRYLAHIIPPAGSELGHGYSTFDFPQEKNIRFNCVEPEILIGKILAHDQKTPVKQAYITVYLAEPNLYNQPKIIANTITDERGIFEALVSPLTTKTVQTIGY